LSSRGNRVRVSLREVKAENLSDAEINNFFIPLGSEMDVITELKNAYLVGHKGSGKSMVLRYLSVDLQILRRNHKKTIPFDHRAMGIFMRCDISKFGGMINPVSQVSFQSPWVKHFTHTFNLSAVYELLRALLLLKNNNLFRIKSEEVKTFITSLMKSLRIEFSDASLDAAINKIDEELGLLQEEYQDNRIADVRRYYTDHKLLYEVRKMVHVAFLGLAKMELVFLLDEYNELGRDQQRVINEMIKIRQPIFKMSSLPYGYFNSRIEEGIQNDIDQDFDLVYLANKALTPKSREFNSTKRFLKAVCNRRLSASGITKDVEQILEVPKPHSRHEGKRTKADIRGINEWNYCGFSNYVLLSSGNPKTILDLLQDTIIRAVEEGKKISRDLIPTWIQLDSIQAFSKEKREAIVNTDSKYGRSLQRLIEYIGKHLKSKSDQKVDYYRLVQIKNDEKLSNLSYETIVLGLKKSWILEAEWERLSDQRVRFRTLTLNNILLPSFELPFGSKQLWQLDASELDSLISGEKAVIEDLPGRPTTYSNATKEKQASSSPPIDFYVYLDDIEKLIQKDQVVIFCGAGLSSYAGYLSGNELKTRLGEELDIDHAGMTLDKVAEAYSIRKGEDQLYSYLMNLFDKVSKPNLELHLKLARLGITRFVTTNWDSLLEDAFKKLSIPHQAIVSPSQIGLIDEAKIGIFKAHGDFDHPEYLVITKKQYISYPKTHKSMITRLESMLQNRSVLFLGYTMDDPNVRMMMENILEQIPLGKVSYGVFRNIQAHEKDRLERDHKIKTIQIELPSFINALAMRIA
jgi:hypothetical protein